MKNVFLVYDDCCFYEIVILNYFMKFTGQDVVICSLNGSAITCIEGYSVNVDMALKDVEIDNIRTYQRFSEKRNNCSSYLCRSECTRKCRGIKRY